MIFLRLMKTHTEIWRSLSGVFFSFLLAGCAVFTDSALQPGQGTAASVQERMGPPAMRWTESAGGETWVYPSGPMGYHTWFLRLDAAGRLIERKNVLDAAHFAQIAADMSEDQVVRRIGPPHPAWTVYFSARNELVWEWRYCDDWNEPARFNVLFDATTRRVRSTYSAPEKLRATFDFQHLPRWCGH